MIIIPKVEVQLIPEWKQVLLKAWSIKFNVLATIFGGAEVLAALIKPEGIPSGLFAGIAASITMVATVARVMAQKELP